MPGDFHEPPDPGQHRPSASPRPPLAQSAAVAADLPSRYDAPVAPYYDPVPLFAWTGLYAGLNGQFGIGGFTQGGKQHFGSPSAVSAARPSASITSPVNCSSASSGCGLRPDQRLGQFRRRHEQRRRHQRPRHGTCPLRLCWDRVLFYGTAGYAGTSINGKVNDFSASPNLLIGQSHYLTATRSARVSNMRSRRKSR